MNYRTFQITGVLLFCVLVVCDQCPSDLEKDQESGSKTRLCSLNDRLGSPSFKCIFTNKELCGKISYVGEGSVCQKRNDNSNTAFKCIDGLWKAIDVRLMKLQRHKRCFLWVFFCEEANAPPRFAYCPEDIYRQNDAAQVGTYVSWQVPTATDPNGDAPRVSQVEGPVSGSYFSEGTTVIKYTATDPQGLTSTCLFHVVVSVITCPDYVIPTPFNYGTQSCSGVRRNVAGSTCVHSCWDGYEMIGLRSYSTCEFSGYWSNSFPSCQAKSCGTPANITNGKIECLYGYSYSQSCFATCNSGYNLVGPAQITCQSNAVWTSVGYCRDAEPPRFVHGCPDSQEVYLGPRRSPVNISWVDPITVDNSQLPITLTYNMTKGFYSAVGLYTIKIVATDRGGNNASCTFQVRVSIRQCSPIPSQSNGSTLCTHDFVEGSSCSLVCNAGFQTTGNTTLTCLRTQMWDSEYPLCKAVSCSNVPEVGNGDFLCLNGHQYSSICSLNCHTGFITQGPNITECLANSTWSTPGVCKDISPPTFPMGCPSNNTVYAARLGQNTTINWTAPQVSDNSNSEINVTSSIQAGTSFKKGKTKVVYTATDANGNRNECSFYVEVKELSCNLSTITKTNRTDGALTATCPDGTVYGASCTLNCSQGYFFVGENRITCERDGSTYPPTVSWKWENQESGGPECRENRCPVLPPPKNGALSCQLGYLGWECVMSCSAQWDVPASTSGLFYCSNLQGIWVPQKVPDCSVRKRPWRVRMESTLFYFTETCSLSTQNLKQTFLTRLASSVFKDACLGVLSCVAKNVQVYCEPMANRRRRSAHDGSRASQFNNILLLNRYRRQTDTHYVEISFEISMAYNDTGKSEHTVYAQYMEHTENILTQLKMNANIGHFNIDHLVADENSVGNFSFHIECPPGTVSSSKTEIKIFSCKGCGKGYYLTSDMVCTICPIGTYAENDDATACTHCPDGLTTLHSGSQNRIDCTVIVQPSL